VQRLTLDSPGRTGPQIAQQWMSVMRNAIRVTANDTST
jgi:hypothetical protein